jgi:hypothetical protein
LARHFQTCLISAYKDNSVVMLNVVMLNVIMLSVIILFVNSDGMVNVVMLIVVMLNVVAPKKSLELFWAESSFEEENCSNR